MTKTPRQRGFRVQGTEFAGGPRYPEPMDRRKGTKDRTYTPAAPAAPRPSAPTPGKGRQAVYVPTRPQKPRPKAPKKG